MLPRDYRFRIQNQMGAQIDFSTDGPNNTFIITAIGWKFDSDGAVVYSSEFTPFADPSANLADAGSANGADQDNSVDLYLGLDCYATFETDLVGGGGQLDIYYEYTTDGGITFPSDAADVVDSEDLIFRRSIIHPGGGDIKAVNFSI